MSAQQDEIQMIFDALDEARQHELADYAAQLMDEQRAAKAVSA
jgi:hypothetical protein